MNYAGVDYCVAKWINHHHSFMAVFHSFDQGNAAIDIKVFLLI